MVSLMVTNANIHSSHLTQQSSATHCTFFNEIFIFILKKGKQIPLTVFNIRALKSCVTVSSV